MVIRRFGNTNYITESLVVTINFSQIQDRSSITSDDYPDLTERIHSKSNLHCFGLRKTVLVTVSTPHDNHRRKRRLQIAPQHRLSRSIIYFLTLTQTSYVAETSRLGLEPRLSVLETDVLPLTPPTYKYAILTRRSRASNRKLPMSVSVNPLTLILHTYFLTQKRNVFDSRCIARVGLEPTTFGL